MSEDLRYKDDDYIYDQIKRLMGKSPLNEQEYKQLGDALKEGFRRGFWKK